MIIYTVKAYRSGTKKWYFRDQLHREDGPAVEWADGTKHWYLNGDLLTEAEHVARAQPVKELTVEEISKRLGYSVKIVKG